METLKLVKNIGCSTYKLIGKTLELADRLGKKTGRLEDLPVVGGSIADMHDVVSMLNDYYKGRYRKLPFAAMLGALVITVYVVSPIDLIPDGLPLLGFVDDAFIVNAILGACLETELKRYRAWRTGQEQAQ